MPQLNKLKYNLDCPEYQEDAKIEVVKGVRDGEEIPVGLHFENKEGDFYNDYRFMNSQIINEKLKKKTDVKFDYDQDPADILVTDTGPGNTLIDAWVRAHYPGKSFDEDSQIARSGKVDAAFLKALLDLPFFQESFPKSTGPEYFNIDRIIEIAPRGISAEDCIATLTYFSAESIALAIQHYTGLENGQIYVSGGGARNPLMMEYLTNLLPGFTIQDSEVLGIESAAKEAVLFALLANETLMDPSPSHDRRLGDSPWMTMGKISLPN
jgi:anhydro-N-acetylmuramic acid kinase